MLNCKESTRLTLLYALEWCSGCVFDFHVIWVILPYFSICIGSKSKGEIYFVSTLSYEQHASFQRNMDSSITWNLLLLLLFWKFSLWVSMAHFSAQFRRITHNLLYNFKFAYFNGFEFIYSQTKYTKLKFIIRITLVWNNCYYQ